METRLPAPGTALSSTCAPGKSCRDLPEPQQRFETRVREGKIEVRRER